MGNLNANTYNLQSMRKLKDIILKPCKNNKHVLEIVLFLIKLTCIKIYKERLLKIKYERKFFESINFDPRVRNGPFKDMIYPELSSVGSELAPKIIGSYEEELLPVIQYFLSQSYSDVIDIGCAEGYYVVGLALKMKTSKIHAYDIDPLALSLCMEMAKLNKVESKITFNKFCSPQTLSSFKFGGKGLIICDCEGYEKILFNLENIENLKNCDILIELHDNKVDGVTSTLLPILSKYHEVTMIKSTKKDPKKFPELARFTPVEQTLILSECRNGILEERSMNWAFVKCK